MWAFKSVEKKLSCLRESQRVFSGGDDLQIKNMLYKTVPQKNIFGLRIHLMKNSFLSFIFFDVGF